MASSSENRCFGGLSSSSGFEDDSEPENTFAPQARASDVDVPMYDPERETAIELNDIRAQDDTNGTDTLSPGNGQEALLDEADEIRALLNSSSEHDETTSPETETSQSSAPSDQPHADTDVRIKSGSPDIEMTAEGLIPEEVIDISDNEDVVIKQEQEDSPFDWTGMPSDPILILDSGDEDPTPAPIKEPSLQPSSEILHTESASADHGEDDVIDLGANQEPNTSAEPTLGKFLLTEKRTIANSSTPQHAEHLQRSDRAEVHDEQPHNAENLHTGNGDLDDNSWMSGDADFDADAAANFRALKRSYKAKCRADTNTMQDDYDFMRAEKVERARLKRLEVVYLASRGDVDAEDKSDEGELFVSSSPRRPIQRRTATSAGNDEDYTPPQSKKRKSNPSRTQAPADMENDLTMNMLAGIENYVHMGHDEQNNDPDKMSTKGGKGRKKPARAKKAEQGHNSASGKKRWAQKDQPPVRKKPTQAGFLNNAGSLLTNNVFDDADAIRDLAPLPVFTETNKTKALKAMVANIPLGDQIRAEKEHIKRATITLGKRKVIPAGNGEWSFTGMESSLRHHQVQGAAWMKDRELGDTQPLGGILADAMGMGKTVMAITLMIANPPTRLDKQKATLVVCTPALLTQWENEISKHVTKMVLRRVMRHHSGQRQTGLGAIDDMENADVVLTTYHEVARSYPKADVPEEVDSSEKLQAWWKQVWDEDREILHKARFYRIILDESQAIKNHLSHTSKACRALMGKHRWTLSGTPIMNRVEELYPYFKFLRVECTGSFSEFTQCFCIEGSIQCNQRLHCMLDQIMIRRTMRDKVLGYPIVSLPTTHHGTERLDFNSVERMVYNIISRRFIRAINKASAKGELDKKPGYGIVMFLRLRQLVAHIFLIQEILQEMFNMESVNKLEKATISGVMNGNEAARDLIDGLRRMVAAKGQPVEANQDRPSMETDSEQFGEFVIQLGQRLRILKDKGKFDELRDEQLCHKCKNVPEEPLVTSCLHVYCKECLVFLAYEASKNNQDSTPCRECGTTFSGSQPCAGLKELVITDFSELSPDLTRKGPRNGRVNMHWVAYDDKLLLSAKIMGVEAQIERWLQEDPNKKIIVFSQFLMIQTILERLCHKKGWLYCMYNGKMSHQNRDKTITSFGKEESKIQIMIASLKCGGIGLNLTMASRCTSVDLWFNSAVEQQAFCRLWRIGQKDETFVTRFVIRNSIDDRLESMQKHKEKIVGGAIDAKNVTANLSIQEVMQLFGDVQFDKKTKKPFIVLDDDEVLDSILPPVPDDEEDPIAWRS